MPLNSSQIIQIAEIPPIPHLVHEIMALADNPTTTSGKLEELVNQEPALVTKILKWVNSALYSFPNKINSVKHAMIILGFSTVKAIASGLALMNAFEGLPGQDKDQTLQIWRHGLTSAQYAKLLSARETNEVQDQLYLACMIQNVGCIVLKQYLGAPYSDFLVTHWPPLTIDENTLFDTNHADIGAALLREWRLSEEVSTLIANHHLELSDESKNLAYLQAANYFTEHTLTESSFTAGNWPDYFQNHLNLSTEFLDSIKTDILKVPKVVNLIMDQS